MTKLLITTIPFANTIRDPLDLLENEGINYLINPLGKKLTEDDLFDLVDECEVIIAGTEPITERVMATAKNLRMISRVGIGLDSVDLLAAEKRNIAVSYTPDAPAPAVAELVVGFMYSLIRHVQVSNLQLHRSVWHRFLGKRLVSCRIGLIGMGRIGGMVLNHLKALGCSEILYNDIDHKELNATLEGIRFVEKEEIYRSADIISLHVPLTSLTKNMITLKEISKMKDGVFLINTSRGGIINERDLSVSLDNLKVAGAAIDVFEQEPYSGILTKHENCILTAHLGSMSVDCRSRMEIEATKEALSFLTHNIQKHAVPEDEYDIQRQGL